VKLRPQDATEPRFLVRLDELLAQLCRQHRVQPADVSDVTQDVIIRWLLTAPRLQVIHNWEGLAHRILLRVVLSMRWRRRHEGATASLDALAEVGMEPTVVTSPQSTDGKDVESFESMRERREAWVQAVAINKLPRRQRQCVETLLEHPEFGTSEIAARLDMSAQEVRRTIARARKKILLLREQFPPSPEK